MGINPINIGALVRGQVTSRQSSWYISVVAKLDFQTNMNGKNIWLKKGCSINSQGDIFCPLKF